MKFVNSSKSTSVTSKSVGNSIPELSEQEANSILSVRERQYIENMENRGVDDVIEAEHKYKR